jgi:hypothetical protein
LRPWEHRIEVCIHRPASQAGVKLNTLLPANLRDATNESTAAVSHDASEDRVNLLSISDDDY